MRAITTIMLEVNNNPDPAEGAIRALLRLYSRKYVLQALSKSLTSDYRDVAAVLFSLSYRADVIELDTKDAHPHLEKNALPRVTRSKSFYADDDIPF